VARTRVSAPCWDITAPPSAVAPRWDELLPLLSGHRAPVALRSSLSHRHPRRALGTGAGFRLGSLVVSARRSGDRQVGRPSATRIRQEGWRVRRVGRRRNSTSAEKSVASEGQRYLKLFLFSLSLFIQAMSARVGKLSSAKNTQHRACEHCTRAKLFCGRNTPCDRCLRLGLECSPARCEPGTWTTVGKRKRKCSLEISQDPNSPVGSRIFTAPNPGPPARPPVSESSGQAPDDMMQVPLILALLKHSSTTVAKKPPSQGGFPNQKTSVIIKN